MLVAAFAAALAAGALSAAGGGAAVAIHCAAPGTHTIAHDARVRVYTRAGSGLGGGRSYACMLRNGRTITLGHAGTGCCERIAPVRLAGAVLAYGERQFGIDSGCTSIAVVDLAARRTLHALADVGCTVDAGIIRSGDVSDLALAPSGAVAWIVGVGSAAAPSYAVQLSAGAGAVKSLEAGPGVTPGSLRLSGSRLSWQSAGAPRSGSLR